MLQLHEYRRLIYPLTLDAAEHPKIATIAEIASFLAGRGNGPLVVARVPADIMQRLGASSSWLLLSRYTANKQKAHPEITSSSFGFLQEVLDIGERIYDREHHAVVVQRREKPYKAAVKVTRSGNEVYLQTFHRSDDRNISSIKRRMGKS